MNSLFSESITRTISYLSIIIFHNYLSSKAKRVFLTGIIIYFCFFCAVTSFLSLFSKSHPSFPCSLHRDNPLFWVLCCCRSCSIYSSNTCLAFCQVSISDSLTSPIFTREYSSSPCWLRLTLTRKTSPRSS